MFKLSLIFTLIAIALPLTDYVPEGLVALTEMQVDKILDMVAAGMRAIGESVKAIWIALSPFLIGYLVIRQAINRKALDANTVVNVKALDAANGLKGEIKTTVEMVKEAVDVIAAAKPETTPGSTPKNPLHLEIHEGPPTT